MFHEHYLTIHRVCWRPLLAVLEHVKERGEIRSDLDSQALVDLPLGASWNRVLLNHAPLNDHFARLLTSTVVDGSQPG